MTLKLIPNFLTVLLMAVAPLAFAARLPVWLSKQLQETAFADFGIRQFLRRETEWRFLEKGL